MIEKRSSESSCQDQSCLAFDYQVEIKEIYNYSNNGKKLTFSEVKVYNATASFDFKVLSYFAETATYNLSLVTRMIQVEGENYFVTAVNVAPKDEKKFAPLADVVEVKSKTKLSEHCRILAEVLNEIRKQDETSWVWNKAKLELGYLSRVVERNLAEFNVEGKGNALVMDSINVCDFMLNPVIYLRFQCLDPRQPAWYISLSCCGTLFAASTICTATCLASGLTGCASCIWAALQGIQACYSSCPKMNICWAPVGFTVSCTRLW